MANPTADFPTASHTPTDVSGFGLTALGSSSPTHTELEGKQEQELKALGDKLGVGSSSPAANKILVGTGTGTSEWQDQNTIIDQHALAEEIAFAIALG